jgi:hypothetical protein
MQPLRSDHASATYFFITDQRSVDRTRSDPAPLASASVRVSFIYRAPKPVEGSAAGA